MKIIFLIATLSLTLIPFAKGNVDCIWTSSKAGITIKYVAPCNYRNQSFIDSLLEKVITDADRKDTSLQILVLICSGWLSYPGADFSNFFSIAYDTLREIDNDYIFDYYWNQETIASNKNGGLNTFQSKMAPLDICATNKKHANKAVGIKIIYDLDYRLPKINWSGIVKAIAYSAKYPMTIKSQQKRDTVRYNTNGWYVSLLSLDTSTINKITSAETAPNNKKGLRESHATKIIYILIGFVGLALTGILVRKYVQHSR